MPKENLGVTASRTALEQSPLHAKPEGSKPGSPAAHDLGIIGDQPQSGFRLAGLTVGHFGPPASNATLSLLSPVISVTVPWYPL